MCNLDAAGIQGRVVILNTQQKWYQTFGIMNQLRLEGRF